MCVFIWRLEVKLKSQVPLFGCHLRKDPSLLPSTSSFGSTAWPDCSRNPCVSSSLVLEQPYGNTNFGFSKNKFIVLQIFMYTCIQCILNTFTSYLPSTCPQFPLCISPLTSCYTCSEDKFKSPNIHQLRNLPSLRI